MKCKVNHCNNNVLCKGLCTKHYTQMRRQGKILKTRYDPNEFVEKTNHIEILIKNKKGCLNGKILIDKNDSQLLHYKWSIDSSGYPQARINGKKQRMHELFLNKNGQEDVDHKNRNKLDNRRINLRACSHQQNSHNSKLYRNNKSGFRGVRWKNGKWYSYIVINQEMIHLGVRKKFDNAVALRKKAEMKYFGKFSPLKGDKIRKKYENNAR